MTLINTLNDSKMFNDVELVKLTLTANSVLLLAVLILYDKYKQYIDQSLDAIAGQKLFIVSASRTIQRVKARLQRHNSTQLNSTRQRQQQLTQFVGRDVINKNTTDLAVRCSTESVEFS